MENSPPTNNAEPFPNIGVSLLFLESIANSPQMNQPMVELARPDLNYNDVQTMSSASLRSLAEQLRVYSGLDGEEEFAKYKDTSVSDKTWLSAVRSPPTTTTHINLCIVKPSTKDTGACYARLPVVAEQVGFVGTPTDFISHAWRYTFKDMVAAVRSEANERDRVRASQGLTSIAEERFYWNDIFVEDQNATNQKPEGYFFQAFREAIVNIGRTVLIMMPFRDAIPLTRAWCVWEIFCSIEAPNTELCIALPLTERNALMKMMMLDFDGIVQVLTDVHVENSLAFKNEDRLKILEIVREKCDGGFDYVNGVICAGLRNWLVENAQAWLQLFTTEATFVKATIGPGTLIFMSQLAKLLSVQGKFDEANCLNQSVLKRRQMTLGDKHLDTLTSLCNAAVGLQQCGKFDEAEPMFRRALAGFVNVLGEEHPTTLTASSRLAVLLTKIAVNVDAAEKLDAAENMLRRVLEMREKVLGAEHPDTLSSVSRLARLLYVQKNKRELQPFLMRIGCNHDQLWLDQHFEEIEMLTRRALKGREKVLGAEHPDTLKEANAMALILQARCKFDEAELLFQQALGGHSKVFGAKHSSSLGLAKNSEYNSGARWIFENGKYTYAIIVAIVAYVFYYAIFLMHDDLREIWDVMKRIEFESRPT